MKLTIAKQFTLLIMGAILISSSSYAATATEKLKVGKVTKSIHYTTVAFEDNSSELSDMERANLQSMVQEAKDMGPIRKVKIAAWSDKDLPDTGFELMEFDRDLAKNRELAISRFLKSEYKFKTINGFNMAESSSWLARTFNTQEAELKSVFSKRGAATPVSTEEFDLIKNEGGPSTAVVIIEHTSY